jgi:hypothetical protein
LPRDVVADTTFVPSPERSGLLKHNPRSAARQQAGPSMVLMHAWRTTLFTVKGLRGFLKDGYLRHEQRFDARRVSKNCHCTSLATRVVDHMLLLCGLRVRVQAAWVACAKACGNRLFASHSASPPAVI